MQSVLLLAKSIQASTGRISIVSIRIALYQPDIPQNAGTIIRLAACIGVAVDLIEPAGFLLGDRQFRRAGLDYIERAALRRFPSWRAYQAPPRGEAA